MRLVVVWIVLLVACGRSPPPEIEVTAQGRVLYGGEHATINQLILAVQGRRDAVKVRADEQVPWMHVQWVLAALHEAGVRRAEIGSGKVVRLSSGYWTDRIWDPAHSITADRCAVELPGTVPYGDVLSIVAAAQADLELGVEALHPWDRDAHVLPSPPHDDPIPRWIVTDLIPPNHYPVNLPVASWCESDEDNDPDDRLVFVLTADGRIFFEERGLTLADFANVLRVQKLNYELKLRRIGKPVQQIEGWSRLYVLLVVDKDAPWQHVQWMVAEIEAALIFKLQFGARRKPYTPSSAHQAARAWAGRKIHPLWHHGKLQVFLHSNSRDTDEVADLTAAPVTPFGDVAHDINEFHAARQNKLNIVGITRAPHAVRKLARLQPVRD